MKIKKVIKKWGWPYIGRGELACEHFIGHGPQIHGCDGCCNRKEYKKKIKTLKIKHSFL